MKKIMLAFVLFGCLFGKASAQDFRIRVTSEGEPLGYAYVFINEGYYASVDSTGTTFIPANRLQPGDTVSARFVGMESAAFVYDGNRPEGSVIALELRPIPIDEVIVTARDPSKRLFRQYVKKYYVAFEAVDSGTRYDGDYYLRFRDGRATQGKYTLLNVRADFRGRWKEADLVSLQPASDTTGLSRKIGVLIQTVYDIARTAAAANQIQQPPATVGMIVKYRGRDEGRHVFLLIKPFYDSFGGVKDSFQTLIRVDPRSGQIVSTEILMRVGNTTFDLSAEYMLRKEKKGMISHTLHPVRMEGTITGTDNRGNDLSAVVLFDRITVHEGQVDLTSRRDR